MSILFTLSGRLGIFKGFFTGPLYVWKEVIAGRVNIRLNEASLPISHINSVFVELCSVDAVAAQNGFRLKIGQLFNYFADRISFLCCGRAT